jgi:membrane protein
MKLRPKEMLGLGKRAVKGWMDDGAASMGAALAFYTMFSMGPLLVMVIMIAGLAIGKEEAQALLMTQLSGLLGDAGAEGVKSVLAAANTKEGGIIATVISGFTLLLGATTVFAELQSDLDRIWKVTKKKASGIWGFLRARLLSFGLVVSIGFLLLISLVVSAAIAYVGENLMGGGATVVMRVLEFAGSLAVLTLLFAIIYKMLPSRRIPWGDVWVGALVTALLFTIGKYLIGLYLGKSATTSQFGAAGTIIVAIFWVYYSAQIFFLGAEFTKEYSMSHGSKALESDAANSDFIRGDAAMVARARRIVKGKDPVVVQGTRDTKHG